MDKSKKTEKEKIIIISNPGVPIAMGVGVIIILIMIGIKILAGAKVLNMIVENTPWILMGMMMGIFFTLMITWPLIKKYKPPTMYIKKRLRNVPEKLRKWF